MTPESYLPPDILTASTEYLDLRAQLTRELPRYLKLLHHGLALLIRRLVDIQAQFWHDIKDLWGNFWEAV
ncbi:hypothetical protein GYMLUDRAFT_48887 [Collybiopsis luxurians FD-317 M1]|uniref:Uncharacterized protein n=1 Tax=Collybiopsis luxurians FD-317 M1 TaxID=944289 RepID=A0A0D0BHG1_9AGAR|nr:hypothetical protein GYMLUDRAFT_48887 [Collybiopsis luxurians FD-317 M1]